MNYYDIVKEQIGSGANIDDVIVRISDLLEEMGGMKCKKVREFIFDEYERVNGTFINERLAHHLVNSMRHSDERGNVYTGELISPAKSLELLSGETPEYIERHRWDAYVAANGFMYDLIRSGLNEEQKLRAAKEFWFHDDDFPFDNKVYWYYKWLV